MPRSYSDHTDSELIELLSKSNERSAFAEIYDRYGKKLVIEAIRKIGDRNTAEDIVQEIFVKLWIRKQRITIEKNLEANVNRENYQAAVVRIGADGLDTRVWWDK